MERIDQPTGSTRRPPRFLPFAVLLAGVALRLVYCAGSDVRHVHDDHFHVIKIMVDERRWPSPDEGWETYQPPLYHACGAITYASARAIAQAAGAAPDAAHAAGRKAVQFFSAIAGSVTLLFVWLILKAVFAARRGLTLVGLATAAFLPRHVYLSAMATNDAMAAMWMTAALWAVLRWYATGGGARWAIFAGATCGLAMLTKAYGLATLAVVVLAVPMAMLARNENGHGGRSAAPAEARGPSISRTGRLRWSRAIVGGGVMVLLAVVVGVWPYARNARLAGSPFVSNYDLLPHAIWHQPPGRVSDVSFSSFRLSALLDRPWLHVSTVDSFWSQIYAEAWFDYGTTMTLFHYRPFVRHISRAWANEDKPPTELFVDQLTWDADVTPDSELVAGRALLVLGLIPTALLVIGCVVGIVRAGRVFPLGLMAVNLLANLAIPIYQTIRQPHFSSMKATFAIGALASGAVLVAAGAEALGWRKQPWLRWIIVLNAVALAVVLTAHLVHVAFFPPDYFMSPTDTL